MIALIDADIVAYRCAAASENDGLEIALVRTDELMRRILFETNSDSYRAFLTGDFNFRREINPDYKAHRTQPKPQYLEDCKYYLMKEWNAFTTDGYEADDALGFNQTEDTVVCSIDKDLLMIPGRHYNFVKQVFAEVTELSGLKHFYKQMLIGDTADNIKGVNGIGKVKATKLIDPLETEEEMYLTVCNLYKDIERFDMNADCLWIMREENVRFSDRCPIL